MSGTRYPFWVRVLIAPHRHSRLLTFALLLLAMGLLMTRPPSIYASGTIRGTVFRDYNGNGVINTTGTSPNYAIDKHLAGVTVTAYDASGASVGSTTSIYCTAASTPQSYCTGYGTGPNYSLAVSGTGPYRVEFTWDNTTAFPTNALYGYQSGPVGTNNTSSVQFVADPAGGTTSNINFGVLQPEDYSQNQPKMAAPLQSAGARTAYTSAYSAMAVWNYGDATAPGSLATNSQIGSTWGLAYDRIRNKIYAGAMLKRHTDFGPLGSGGIYELDPTTGNPTTFVDLDTIGGIDTGDTSTPLTRSLSTAFYTPDDDVQAFNYAGKYSLGDIDITDDGSTLYIVNLFQRKLIALTVATKTVAAQYDLTALPGGATACPTADLRPWAIKLYRGQVYVGVVCSAESTKSAANMRGYIWRLNGSSFVNVMDFPLNYVRIPANANTTRASEWHPWISTTTSPYPINYAAGDEKYSEPTISDIEFDDKDNMFIGFLDRFANQSGYQQSNPIDGTLNEEAFSAGDILLACRSGAGWVLENGPSDSTCRGWPGEGIDPSRSGGGPGAGEFIYAEGLENESSFGALAVLHGTGKITLTTGDPGCTNCGGVDYIVAPTGTNPSLTAPDGGTNPGGGNGTSQDSGSLQLYSYENGKWGKGTGMGDIELISLPAPVEIGNRVWKDTNGNGRQDPGEAGITGVTVQLVLVSTNTVISTVTTDSSGNYLFSGASGTTTTSAAYNLSLAYTTAYKVIVPNAVGSSRQSALTTAGVQYISTPLNDPSTNGILRDSNGIQTPTSGDNYNLVAAVTTGGPGVNNHTIDFGFNNVTPTASALDAFDAAHKGAKKVTLTWRTSSEITTLGFNVWRSQKKDGKYRLLTAQPMPATALGQIAGADYAYLDSKVKRSKTYYYKLEILQAEGTSNWSSIVKVKLPK